MVLQCLKTTPDMNRVKPGWFLHLGKGNKQYFYKELRLEGKVYGILCLSLCEINMNRFCSFKACFCNVIFIYFKFRVFLSRLSSSGSSWEHWDIQKIPISTFFIYLPNWRKFPLSLPSVLASY